MNLNILGKDNIVCILLVNATICLNSIEELNISNLRNCTQILPFCQWQKKKSLNTVLVLNLWYLSQIGP